MYSDEPVQNLGRGVRGEYAAQPESSFVFQIKRVHQVDLILQANRRLSDIKKKLHVLTNRFSKSRR